MKKLRKHICSLGLIFFPLISLYTHAQSSRKDTLEQNGSLQEITIRENRLHTSLLEQNKNIQIITRKQIAQLPVRSLNEVLSYIAGVDMRQRGPGGIQADISIDGGSFDQTLVLINGIRVTDPQTGHNMMNLPITLDIIDHIEILHGPAARIYGINALTGAVNIITRTPESNALQLTVYGGSNFDKNEPAKDRYNNWGGRITASKAGLHGNHLFSFSHDKGNGYRYNTAFNNTKIFYQGQIKTNGKDHLDFLAGYVYNDFGANGFYAPPGDINSGENARNLLLSAGYQRQVSPIWTMTPRISYRFSQDDYRYIKDPITARNLHKTHIFDAGWNNTIHTATGDIGFGLEARKEHIISSNLGNHQRNNYGISGEYRFSQLGAFSLTAGGYLNYNSAYGWQFFPGVDAGYFLNAHWKLFTNIGTGQRLPTYTDLYYTGPSNIGNPGLSSEKARYAEAGIKYFGQRVSFTAAYFIRSIRNFIDWTKQTATDPWQPNNFQHINTQGINVSGTYTLPTATGNALRNPVIEIRYAHLDPHIAIPAAAQNTLSLYAISSLRNQLAVLFHTDLPAHLHFQIAGRYQQRISYKDYFLLDSRISYSLLEKLRIYADGTNITNITYTEAAAAPMPGKWYTLGVNIGL